MPVKIWRAIARPEHRHGVEPGTVIEADARHGLIVACGRGALQLLELQKPGGKRLAAEEFLQGYTMQGGSFER